MKLGVYEIHIVVGYRASEFSYLKDKFGVNIIYNESYKSKNNIFSFCKALDFFGDSFVIDADVVLLKNIFKINNKQSFYYISKRACKDKFEWVLLHKNNRAIGVKVSKEPLASLLGISFFAQHDAEIIKDRFKSLTDESFNNPSLYYDSVIVELLDQICVGFCEIYNSFVGELDDIDDLKEINEKLKRLYENGML